MSSIGPSMKKIPKRFFEDSTKILLRFHKNSVENFMAEVDVIGILSTSRVQISHYFWNPKCVRKDVIKGKFKKKLEDSNFILTIDQIKGYNSSMWKHTICPSHQASPRFNDQNSKAKIEGLKFKGVDLKINFKHM